MRALTRRLLASLAVIGLLVPPAAADSQKGKSKSSKKSSSHSSASSSGTKSSHAGTKTEHSTTSHPKSGTTTSTKATASSSGSKPSHSGASTKTEHTTTSHPKSDTTTFAKTTESTQPRASTKTSTATHSTSSKAVKNPAVVRSADGRIQRSEAAKDQFMRQTGYPHGRPGYVVDHIKPLACGGADAPSNMQWQTVADAKAKDKFERIGCK